MRTVNTAIIGFGAAGQIFLAPFIGTNPGFKLQTIVTSDEGRAANAHKLYPGVKIEADSEAVFADDSIELVVIGTSNTSHLELSKKALLAGKHVLVEKPFTITSADADELIALSKQVGKIITVHHNRRFDSGHNTVKKVLADGKLGRFVEMEVHYDRFRPGLRANAWREKALPGSGILYDLGAHLIDGALDLFGLPEEITALIITQRPGLEVDDNFELILHYAGLKVTLKAGMLVKALGPVYQLYGDAGTFIKYGMDVQEEDLKAGKTPLDAPHWGEEPQNIWGTLTLDDNGATSTETVPSEKGRYQDLFANVYEAIANGAELIVKPEQARNTIRVIELAFKSSAEKRTVKFE